MDDPYIKLAKDTVEAYVKTGNLASQGETLRGYIRRAGVFVSIHTKSGELRGCIGTFLPTQPNMAQEIIHNAIAAAASDPRFPPVTPAELPSLIYSVDILSEPELVANQQSLDPKKYGLIVQSANGKHGLLLPDLEGVDTVEEQIAICRQKAWISKDEPITLSRFTVERHGKK